MLFFLYSNQITPFFDGVNVNNLNGAAKNFSISTPGKCDEAYASTKRKKSMVLSICINHLVENFIHKH